MQGTPRFYLPGAIAIHTLFCRQQEEEFVDKLRGMTYAEIAAKGRGILNSAAKLNKASEKVV